jgi:hypothetical protein
MNDQPAKYQFLIFHAEDGKTKIDVRFEEIFESGELVPEATIRNFRIVRQEGRT